MRWTKSSAALAVALSSVMAMAQDNAPSAETPVPPRPGVVPELPKSEAPEPPAEDQSVPPSVDQAPGDEPPALAAPAGESTDSEVAPPTESATPAPIGCQKSSVNTAPQGMVGGPVFVRPAPPAVISVGPIFFAVDGLHPRFPYYSYRRPWYTPGPASTNVTIIW